MLVLKVFVQLPDGTFKRLPIARARCAEDGGTQVVKEKDRYNAQCYAHYVLPDHISFDDEA